MVNDLFWDTSGFYAALNSDDTHHQQAQKVLFNLRQQQQKSVTTDWVIGETCTLLSVRKRPHLISKFLDIVDRSDALTVIHVDSDMFHRSKKALLKYCEKGVSFTDCTSFTIMRDLKLTKAITSDEHFLMAGFTPLLKKKR